MNDAVDPLPSQEVGTLKGRGRMRLPLTTAVLAWRAERVAHGLPVGALPDWPDPPAVPEVPSMPLGLMVWRPF